MNAPVALCAGGCGTPAPTRRAWGWTSRWVTCGHGRKRVKVCSACAATQRPDPRPPGGRRSKPGDLPTPRQQIALDLVTQGWRRGCPPTLREIGEHMGIRSTNGVSDLLRALERKGWLEHRPGEQARCSYRPTERRPAVTPAWLLDQAERLVQSIDQHYGSAVLESDLACSHPWWRLVVTTGGWSENEDAVAAVDPVWHGLTHQASVRGGLHVWAWGPVPAGVGGELGPVIVRPRPYC